MKKIGTKVNHYKQENDYRFVILSENEETERFPKSVKVASVMLYDYSVLYVFDLGYEDGKREFFVENEESETVFEIEEMANAQEWKYRHEHIMYKKCDEWYIFYYDSGVKSLGKEIIENNLFIRQQDDLPQYQISQLGISSNSFDLVCDSYLQAETDGGGVVILAHEIGKEPEVYVWIDGESPRHPYENIKDCLIDNQRFLWYSDTGKLVKIP